MPYSHPFYKNRIAEHIRSVLRPDDKVLDIGVGCGTYAELLPEITMDGVEIYDTSRGHGRAMFTKRTINPTLPPKSLPQDTPNST